MKRGEERRENLHPSSLPLSLSLFRMLGPWIWPSVIDDRVKEEREKLPYSCERRLLFCLKLIYERVLGAMEKPEELR